MQTISPDEQARIAAEVAARYGVLCKPEAVQRVPTGESAYRVDYLWDGKQLVPQVKQQSGDALRRSIDGAWREAARKRRLAGLERKATAAASPRKSSSEEHLAMVRAQAEARAEAIRKMAEAGATLDDIAAHMGIKWNSARKYCQHWKIKAAPKHGGRSGQAVKADARRQAVLEFVGQGEKTIGDVAGFLRITWAAAQKYVKALGIPVLKRQQPRVEAPEPRPKAAPKPKPAPRPDLTERRKKVAQMFKDGFAVAHIAQELGISRFAAQKDLDILGIRRSDFPRMWKTKARAEIIERAHAEIEKRRAEVLRLRSTGTSIPKIAEVLACSKSAVQRDMRALGISIKVNPCGFVGNPEYIRQVKAMRARQMTVREIAAELQLAKSTVLRLIHAGAA